MLVDRYCRLGRALGSLEGDVEALWKEANTVVPTSDNGEDRNLHVGTTTMTTSAMIMGGAEVTMEN